MAFHHQQQGVWQPGMNPWLREVVVELPEEEPEEELWSVTTQTTRTTLDSNDHDADEDEEWQDEASCSCNVHVPPISASLFERKHWRLSQKEPEANQLVMAAFLKASNKTPKLPGAPRCQSHLARRGAGHGGLSRNSEMEETMGKKQDEVSLFEVIITYGPHKAVAEVSNHNELIGRKSRIQLIRMSMDFTFNCFVLN